MNVGKGDLNKMGRSRTCVYQTGKYYTLKGSYYLAKSEYKEIVTFVPAIGGYGKKVFHKKQRYRSQKLINMLGVEE